jgi:hypothetical protein
MRAVSMVVMCVVIVPMVVMCVVVRTGLGMRLVAVVVIMGLALGMLLMVMTLGMFFVVMIVGVRLGVFLMIVLMSLALGVLVIIVVAVIMRMCLEQCALAKLEQRDTVGFQKRGRIGIACQSLKRTRQPGRQILADPEDMVGILQGLGL